MRNILVSLFTDIHKPDVVEHITLSKCIDKLKTGEYLQDTIICREAYLNANTGNDEEIKKYNEAKLKLALVMFHAVANSRNKAGIEKVNPVIVYDIDKIGSIEKVKDILSVLQQDKHIIFAYITPSGQGIKILLSIPYEMNDYPNAWSFGAEYLARKFDLTVDKACKDISRAHFVVHLFDDEYFVNYDAEALPLPEFKNERTVIHTENNDNPDKSMQLKTISNDRIRSYIQKIYDNSSNEIRSCTKSTGNDTLNKKAFLMGQISHYGIFEYNTVRDRFTTDYLSRGGHTHDEAIKTFNSGWNEGVNKPKDIELSNDNQIRNKIKEMSLLSDFDYQIEKMTAAKELGVSITYIDTLMRAYKKRITIKKSNHPGLNWELEPWEDEVDGLEIYHSIKSIMRKFVIANEEFYVLSSLWIIMTYFMKSATIAPMAMITAPEAGCGKSIALQVFGSLVYKPLISSNISAAAIYRVIELEQPTLLLDEADTYMGNNDEMRGILNSGHTKKTAFVIRVDKNNDKPEPTVHSTWAAKVIAGIKLEVFNRTLTSRSIILRLRRKGHNEKTENFRHADTSVFEVIRRKLLRFSEDHLQEFSKLAPILPNSENRDTDNYEPLLAIAQIIGDDIFEETCNAAKNVLDSTSDNVSYSTALLIDIKEIFDNSTKSFFETSEILNGLIKYPDSRWTEFKNGKPISAKQIATILKEFGIKPIQSTTESRKRGYLVKDFNDAFSRYLPQSSSDIGSTMSETLTATTTIII